MLICQKCGRKLPDRAKFCDGCGAYVEKSRKDEQGKRKEFYDGEVHKCPRCGSVMNAFQAKCECGHEFRGIETVNSVQTLATKLERICNERQKIELIKTFPIPNTKEDIIEFMILAVSNFDANYYCTHLDEEDISDAWFAKIEQCYLKAKITFEESDLKKVENIYFEIKEKINKEKNIEEKEKAKVKQQKERNKHLKVIIPIVASFLGITLIVLAVVGFALRGFNSDPDAIRIGVSYEDLEGMHYSEVVELLEEKGFTNITTKDDGWNLLQKSGTVKSVSIDGCSEFYGFSKFLPDDLVIIYYYS